LWKWKFGSFEQNHDQRGRSQAVKGLGILAMTRNGTLDRLVRKHVINTYSHMGTTEYNPDTHNDRKIYET
jgi:hypothetical protein